MMRIIEDLYRGNVRAVARAISMVESGGEEREVIVSGLNRRGINRSDLDRNTPASLILGVTGPPGAGKSTIVDRLIQRERRDGRRVAVVAVDPSSPFTGGALLGDRIRMQEHATDDGVFIRSMASRGRLGGIANATGDAVKVLNAAGYDTVIIETVGVGQDEVDIVHLSDLVLLVLVPGTGDGIQVMKAGVMEIGDVFVINKKDLEGADRLCAELDYVLGLRNPKNPDNDSRADNTDSENPIVMVSATRDEGIDELLYKTRTAIADMRERGLMEERRRRRIEQELRSIIAEKTCVFFEHLLGVSEHMAQWVEMVYNGEVDPYTLIRGKIGELEMPEQPFHGGTDS